MTPWVRLRRLVLSLVPALELAEGGERGLQQRQARGEGAPGLLAQQGDVRRRDLVAGAELAPHHADLAADPRQLRDHASIPARPQLDLRLGALVEGLDGARQVHLSLRVRSWMVGSAG